jgi:hypothetical protein
MRQRAPRIYALSFRRTTEYRVRCRLALDYQRRLMRRSVM